MPSGLTYCGFYLEVKKKCRHKGFAPRSTEKKGLGYFILKFNKLNKNLYTQTRREQSIYSFYK